MIHDLKRQGLGVSAIARRTGLDRKTVRKYLDEEMERGPGRTVTPRGNPLSDVSRGLPDASAPQLADGPSSELLQVAQNRAALFFQFINTPATNTSPPC